jgi:hypothetical protein
MKWYLTKIIFRIICGNGIHTAQFDEQLRLIYATDEIAAITKAKAMGQNEQERFMNKKNELVQWKFITVSELYPLTAMIDGAELYARIYETNYADVYLDDVNYKAKQLIENNSNNILQLL